MIVNESFGASLKRERELRGISLQELAQATRIRRPYLEAIESDHFEALPGLTFLKGYVRTYAQYVGLPTAEVMVRLESFIGAKAFEKKNPPIYSRPLFRILLGLFLLGLGALLWVGGLPQ